ncbi:hypothetical protein HUJ04_009935 [Dendroctonus ponderosae]|nr:hypothetical protein HUJ04_009935 [Dendroctonus ponderosae]
MKSIFLLALVGFVASIPLETSPILYNSKLRSYGYQGNSFVVPEYIAYQFSQAQKAGYTPAQVVAYLLERGYPEYVAHYLAEQYEAGLSKPYFQSPYEIFRYFYKQGINDNVREYINQQISQVYQQSQIGINGQQIYGQKFLNVPVPFSQYVVQQRNYFNQYEKIFSGAKSAYQLLQLVEQHVQNAIQILSNGYYQQSEHQYIYQKLVHGLGFLKNGKEVYQTYQNYQEKYIPYYVAQYYAQQAALVYKYLQETYQYIEGKEIYLPQQFVQELLVAYEAAQKAYQAYQPSFFSKVYQIVVDEPSNLNHGQTPYSSSYSNYGPYSSSYLYITHNTALHTNMGHLVQISIILANLDRKLEAMYTNMVPTSKVNMGNTTKAPAILGLITLLAIHTTYGEKYGSSRNYAQISSYTPCEYGSYVPSTYKVWDGVQSYGYQNPLKNGFSNTYPQIAAIDLVEKNIRASLSYLGLKYVDLYLIHWPVGYKEDLENFPKDAEGNILFSDVDYLDTWKAMEEIECHPYLNQKKLIDFAHSKGIAVTAYSPLGSPDRPWAQPGDPQLLEDSKLLALSKKYQKTPAQILLRYQVDRGVIVIPKSVTKARIQQNIDIFDFKLSPEDIAYIDTFDVNGRLCPLATAVDHKYHPFTNDEY